MRNREEWNPEKCLTVWTKTGHGLLPKTNSEYSQMDFPSQSCVNERKQGSASQGLHCDPVPPSSRETSPRALLLPAPLSHTWSSLPGIPGKQRSKHPPSVWTSDILWDYTYDSEDARPKGTRSRCQLHFMFFLSCRANSWNLLQIKTRARCSQRAEMSHVCCR